MSAREHLAALVDNYDDGTPTRAKPGQLYAGVRYLLEHEAEREPTPPSAAPVDDEPDEYVPLTDPDKGGQTQMSEPAWYVDKVIAYGERCVTAARIAWARPVSAALADWQQRDDEDPLNRTYKDGRRHAYEHALELLGSPTPPSAGGVGDEVPQPGERVFGWNKCRHNGSSGTYVNRREPDMTGRPHVIENNDGALRYFRHVEQDEAAPWLPDEFVVESDGSVWAVGPDGSRSMARTNPDNTARPVVARYVREVPRG